MPGTTWENVSGGSGGGPSFSLSASNLHPTAVTVTLAISSGTLQTWTLQYRSKGATSWTTYATGITTLAKTVNDLSANHDYEFQAIDVLVTISGVTAILSASTPAYPPVAYEPKAWWGRSHQVQNQAVSIQAMVAVGGSGDWSNTATATTQAVEFRNMHSTRTIRAIRVLTMSHVGSNHATISVRAARRGNGSITNPQGSFAQGTWGGQPQYTCPDGSWSPENVKYALTDLLVLPDLVAPGDSIAMQFGISGGNQKVVTLGLDNSSDYAPCWRDRDSTIGDIVTPGSTDAPTWSGFGGSNVAFSVLCYYNDNIPTPNFVAFGDSRFANVYPLNANPTTGLGWTQMATATMQGNDLPVSICSFAQGAFTVSQTAQRFASALRDGILAYCDGIMYEGWSWNSRGGDPSPTLAAVAAAKVGADSADKKFWCVTIAPPGNRNAAEIDPVPTNFDADQLAAYDAIDADHASTFGGAYTNIQSALWLSTNHRQWNLTLSNDNVHANYTGQVAQANAIVAAVPGVLTALGMNP